MACLKVRYLPAFLLLASYYFYAGWNIYYLPLLLATTLLDYGVCRSLACENASAQRKRLLALSLVGNLGLLFFFKYGNFIWDNFVQGPLRSAGVEVPVTLAIVLPIGISFYTFQSMGHSIDVYRRKFTDEINLRDFALYVSFFPQLVAGPILRGADFFPQLKRLKCQRDWWGGLDLILTGFLKKVLIADNLAVYVDTVFADLSGYSRLEISLATYAFAAQIYCDFSGYTDIARGVAKWLGIEIPINFNYPYFSQSIAEFWRRWHISLSSWLKDYLYISLGGNRGGHYKTLRNLFLTMALGGFWHGAAWNFLAWGAYHGVLLVLAHGAVRREPSPNTRWWIRVWRVVQTFHLVLIGWFLFRIEHLGDVVMLWQGDTVAWVRDAGELANMLAFLFAFVCVHSLRYATNMQLVAEHRPLWSQVAVVSAVGVLLVLLGAPASNFIYFQF